MEWSGTATVYALMVMLLMCRGYFCTGLTAIAPAIPVLHKTRKTALLTSAGKEINI